MAGVNKAILVGNLGNDPELRQTGSGMAVCNFRIATSEKYKDEERTEWHRIVTFGKLADICGQYLKKGRQVYIEGRIQTREWEKDGEKKYTTEIVANQMQMLGSKGDAQTADFPPIPPKQEPFEKIKAAFDADEIDGKGNVVDDDDPPF